MALIHGGFWRARYTKALMRALAAAVVGQGWAAWNVEYRRVGPGGGGGGWPTTFDDVAAAVRRLSSMGGIDAGRVATCGHSAGGQLALWVAGEPEVELCAAVSLAGVLDMHAAARSRVGARAVQALLGGAPDEVPERYLRASPLARLPLGVPQLVVHGTGDTVVPPDMSERYVAAAAVAGDDVRGVALPGVGHRGVIARRGPACRAVLAFLDHVFGPPAG